MIILYASYFFQFEIIHFCPHAPDGEPLCSFGSAELIFHRLVRIGGADGLFVAGEGFSGAGLVKVVADKQG